ncbi:MAG: tRNA dihydrouridine synthase DusB [Smithellaceae bacterium]
MFAGINSLKGKALLAPLAGISNLPFRLIARSFGCALAYTEMISANGLIRKTDKTFEYLKTCVQDKPLGMQIFGADPEIMAQAAFIVAERGADLVDINMGCPVKKVIKAGAGAILMKDPGLVARIIAGVKKAVPIPVTVKIRSGWNISSINAVEIARIAEDSGADAVTVHGRTADQGYSGIADWKIIAAVKEAVHIPVVGNGDVWQPQDAVRMVAQTSCDAVMVGRGVLGNPWLFAGINQKLALQKEDYLPDLVQRYEIIMKHWSMEAEMCGSRAAARNFRKHLLWYTKGLEGSSRFRKFVSTLSDRESMRAELDKYFQSLASSPLK